MVGFFDASHKKVKKIRVGVRFTRSACCEDVDKTCGVLDAVLGARSWSRVSAKLKSTTCDTTKPPKNTQQWNPR